MNIFTAIWLNYGKLESTANPIVDGILGLVLMRGWRVDTQSKICPDYGNLKLSAKVE